MRASADKDPPNIAGALASELTGREFLQRIVDGQLPPPPIAALLGARLVSVGDGEAVFRCAPDESTCNPIGMVHGGFLGTLLDSAAGCAVHSLLPAGPGYASIEIKVSFLRALRTDTGELEIRGRALRVGQRVAFAEAHAATGENHRSATPQPRSRSSEREVAPAGDAHVRCASATSPRGSVTHVLR